MRSRRPPNAAHGNPPHHLAEDGEVGGDAEALLGAAPGDPEPGDHLVEDQERTMLVAEPAEPFEVSVVRRDHTHVRGERARR